MPEYYAPTTLGLEGALEQELRALGAVQVETRPGGCRFQGDAAFGQAACLHLRTAVRVQEFLIGGEVSSAQDLYEWARTLPWEEIVPPDRTLAVDAALTKSPFPHASATALTIKDAVVDRVRAKLGNRPSVSKDSPDVPLRLIMHGRHARLYRDLAGESLHKRGYRQIQVKSPLNEAIAAGLLLLTGCPNGVALLDPMCGSGTFLIEAALIAKRRAPGWNREFAFERWPGFDAAAFNAMKTRAAEQELALADLPPLFGSDQHAGALEIARQSAARAGVGDAIHFEVKPIDRLVPSFDRFQVVVNPPWGERLDEEETTHIAWADLGRFLHERCRGQRAHVLSGNADLTRHLGLRASRRYALRTGPIDCRFLTYEIDERR